MERVVSKRFFSNSTNWLAYVFFPLALATWLYYRFRETDHLLGGKILAFNKAATPTCLPNFVIDNLPDGLWVFAFMLATGLIWKHESFSKGRFWLFFVPLVGLISEFAQASGHIMGTFDWKDLVAYFIGMGMATILIFFKFFKTNS